MKRILLLVTIAASLTSVYLLTSGPSAGRAAGRVSSLSLPANYRELGQARAPAALTPDQAEHIAAKEFGDSLPLQTATVRYGSFTDDNYRRALPGEAKPVGTIDAWEVTFSGLYVDRPCAFDQQVGGPAPSCPPPITSLSVIIDDKAGAYVEAVGI